MRFFIFLISFSLIASSAWAGPKKSHHKKSPKRIVDVRVKKRKGMSESQRKALAKKQVAHARYLASLRDKQSTKKESVPEFRANEEVTIKDYGFEEQKPIADETVTTVTSIDLRDENTYAPIQGDPNLGWNTVQQSED